MNTPLSTYIKGLGLALVLTLCAGPLLAADPTATSFTSAQCEGSSMPYPTPKDIIATPDSLTPLFINHVGRHGARYLSSPKAIGSLRGVLEEADSMGTITPAGKRMLAFTRGVMRLCKGRYGALDSLGMAEQRGIASRMFRSFPKLFRKGRVQAISSRVPRCVNSMYTFLYQITRLDNDVDISTTSGPVESPLLRPWDVDQAYIEFKEGDTWAAPYQEYLLTNAPLTPLIRLLGPEFPLQAEEARETVMNLYKVVSGMSAMSVKINSSDWFTPQEYNALWACDNLQQYLVHTASTVSMVPAESAAPLLLELIHSTQAAVDASKAKKPGDTPTVMLRFGHAETLMPLLSLMRLPGSYYMTNYFDTVALHWQNFHNVPMASNLQIILMRSRAGKYYISLRLNEVPVSLDPDTPADYIPWDYARERLLRCIPLYLRV